MQHMGQHALFTTIIENVREIGFIRNDIRENDKLVKYKNVVLVCNMDCEYEEDKKFVKEETTRNSGIAIVIFTLRTPLVSYSTAKASRSLRA